MTHVRSGIISIVLLCSAIIIAGCSASKPPYTVTARDYRIYSSNIGKEIALSDVIADAASVDVVIFGEEHNDAVGHYLEKAILEDLATTYHGNVVLSMEMFERDVQGVVNEYVEGLIRDKDLVKDGRAWANYKDYRPLVDFAKKNKLVVLAANAPGRYASMAGLKGPSSLNAIADHAKRFIAPLPYDTATGAYYKKLLDVSEHAMPAPKKDTTKKTAAADTSKPAAPAQSGPPSFNIIYGQSLWDATMASTIAQYHKDHPGTKIFQVNGRFHSDEGFGIVQQLHHYDPACKVMVISSGSDSDFVHPPYDSLKKNGNIIIVTNPDVPKTFGE